MLFLVSCGAEKTPVVDENVNMEENTVMDETAPIENDSDSVESPVDETNGLE